MTERNPILQSLFDRKSVRVYEEKPIPAEMKQAILEAAAQAPSAGCQQLYTILDITDPALKEALAESCNAGTLTRTIIKQDQYGNEYAGNAVSARYTKTITLPNGASGFQGWYKDGEDAYGNVEWASLLYRMDWEELYGIVDGIKCRATGSGMTEEELRQPEYRRPDRTRSGGRLCVKLPRKVCLCPAIVAARRAGQPQRGHQSGLFELCPILLLGAEPAFFRRQYSRLSECSRPSKYFPV